MTDSSFAPSARGRSRLRQTLTLALACLSLALGAPVALQAGGQEDTQGASVQYWSRDDVFGGRGLLFDGNATPVHRIYGLRFDSAIPAEVHARHTDVVFVLDGSATVVTGGQVLEPRSPREHEIVGSGIRGGAPQTLGPGDVLIIPAGTPHRFEQIDGAIDFLAVQVQETSPQSVSQKPVRKWSASQFFGAGPLVFDARDEGGNFQVFAVRRDGQGMAEVHDAARDIIFVLEGAASFVTGGSVIEPRTPRPGETLGAGVREGTTHDLGPGDVITVPSGTPHWFESVDGYIEYLALKFVF